MVVRSTSTARLRATLLPPRRRARIRARMPRRTPATAVPLRVKTMRTYCTSDRVPCAPSRIQTSRYSSRPSRTRVTFRAYACLRSTTSAATCSRIRGCSLGRVLYSRHGRNVDMGSRDHLVPHPNRHRGRCRTAHPASCRLRARLSRPCRRRCRRVTPPVALVIRHPERLVDAFSGPTPPRLRWREDQHERETIGQPRHP